MTRVWHELAAAYGGFGRWIGIILAAVPVLSWLSERFRVSFAELVARIVDAYRAVFHPIADFLLAYLPFTPPDWAKDGLVFYLVVGGAVARTLWSLYVKHDPDKGEVFGPPVFGRFSTRLTQAIAVALTVPLWPLALLSMLLAPYVMRNPNNGNVFSGNREAYDRWCGRKARHAEYVCNLRWVFVLQLLGVLGVCAVIVFSTAAGA